MQIVKSCDKLITGVVVTHNSKELFIRSFESLRAFHPNMRIIIIDGSEESDPCYKYIESFKKDNIKVFQMGYNIGHGRGMCLGIYYVETPYVLFFDSDIEVVKSPIKEMMEMFEEDTFGVGYIEKTGFDGFMYGVHTRHFMEGWMPYLHPYFQLTKVKEYYKYHPYVHHGAPCVWTMLDIYRRGLSGRILKDFNGKEKATKDGWSWQILPSEYVIHDVAGTRHIRKNAGKREIEGNWDNRGG